MRSCLKISLIMKQTKTSALEYVCQYCIELVQDSTYDEFWINKFTSKTEDIREELISLLKTGQDILDWFMGEIFCFIFARIQNSSYEELPHVISIDNVDYYGSVYSLGDNINIQMLWACFGYGPNHYKYSFVEKQKFLVEVEDWVEIELDN